MAMTMPDVIVNDNLLINNKKLLDGTWVANSTAKNQWLVVKITEDHTSNQTVTYEGRYYSDGANGKLLNTVSFGTDTIANPSEMPLIVADFKARAQKGAAYKKAQQALKDFKALTIEAANATNADGNYVSTDIPVVLPADLAKVRWNPPSHYSTRPLPFYINAGIVQTGKPDTLKGYDINGNPIYRAPQVTQQYVNGLLNLTKNNSSNLGKIYQTLTTAKILQTKTIKMKKTGKEITIEPQGPEDLWGFKFIYNPTTISYDTSLYSSIDWLQAPKDPSTFFGGNVSITFDLYLNRIADMSTLQNPATIAEHYPTGLTDEQKIGILSRGTEYDIEYLYRVVNGNPVNTTLTPDTIQATSDFGYITGLPFWLHLHKNMVFKASLSSISVNHVMFTENMVPMLSVVSLSFIRYPETGKTGDVKERLTNYIKTGNW